MDVEIRCLACNSLYFCKQSNTKIVGPIISTVCPECKHEENKNYSAFLDAQCDHVRSGNYVLHSAKARKMIALARVISKIISNEESFKKKKK
jgi:hypothetical protein